MKTYHITTLAGDGIGAEIMQSAEAVLHILAETYHFTLQLDPQAFGGAGIDQHGHPFAESVQTAVKNSQAILLGAVGGDKWKNAPVSPEQGLLQLRKSLDLYANVRPLSVRASLAAHSPLKPSTIADTDLIIVRELSAGAYFGQPRHNAQTHALDSITYSREEIRRIVRFAFELAQQRRKKLTSVDKANVLATSQLWRSIVEEEAVNYPEVTLEHQLVDAMAMHLITRPRDFDVIVTENLFGDILSDEASVLGGSLGVLPSASFGERAPYLYEPAHGSAPDIAGQNRANPIAMLLSVALMLRHSFNETEAANTLETAVAAMIDENRLTADLNPEQPLTTSAFTAEIIKKIKEKS